MNRRGSGSYENFGIDLGISPRIVGGIARHVNDLYPEIVKLGHEIHLITVEFGQCPAYEVVDGVHLYRVPVQEPMTFFTGLFT